MAVQVPGIVRETWGDEVVVEAIPWLQEMIREYGIPRDGYREVLSRLESLEKEVSLVKEGLFQTRAEFREDLGELRREMNERFDRMNERFDQVYHQMVVQTRWLVGSLTLIGTVISVLLAIAQFTP